MQHNPYILVKGNTPWKNFGVLCLTLALCFGLQSAAFASEAKIKAQFDTIAKKLVHDAAKNIMPHKNSKAVTKEDGVFKARYIEIDESNVMTEIHHASGNDYAGTVKYRELFYVCTGSTKAQALAAPCSLERTRSMTEIVAYTKGKWLYH